MPQHDNNAQNPPIKIRKFHSQLHSYKKDNQPVGFNQMRECRFVFKLSVAVDGKEILAAFLLTFIAVYKTHILYNSAGQSVKETVRFSNVSNWTLKVEVVAYIALFLASHSFKLWPGP